MRDLSNTVRILHDPHATPERYLRRQALLRQLANVFLGLLSLGFLVSSVANLVAAWRTGTAEAWQVFWHNPFGVLGFSPLFFLFRRDMHGRDLLDSVLQPYVRLAEVRQAAITGDDTLAPLAEKQPTPPTTTSVGEHEVEFGPLNYPSSLHSRTAAALAWYLFGIALCLGIAAIVLLGAIASGLNPEAAGIFALLVLATVGCVAFRRVALQRYRTVQQPFTAVVDASGVTWRSLRSRRRQQRIRWDEAQALVCVQWRSYAVYTEHTAYALLAPHAVLTWEITKDAKGSDWATARDLAGIIYARTGLPLRDLSVALNDALSLAATPASAKPKIRFPLGTPGTPDAIPGIPPASSAALVESDPHAARRMLQLGSLVALLAIPLTLVYGAGYGLQRIQSSYYSALITQAEAQSPLYVDALNNDDGQWPVQHATATDTETSIFTRDSSSHVVYLLTGSDPGSVLWAWQPVPFDDALVEVTTRQLPDVTNQGNGGVGLLLRERGDGNQFVEFHIDPWGEWQLWDYSQSRRSSNGWREIAGGDSSAIHKGTGVPNRVAVLMRGDQFIAYVNGAFIAAETDPGAPASGPAGVYADVQTAGGQFSDFTVYPLPNTPPLWWS